MIIDTTSTESIIAFIAAAIAAFIAWWQNRQKKEVINFYSDPVQIPEAQTISQAVLSQLPTHSYKMGEATKRWLTFDATIENKASILKQIEQAENQGLTKYRINFAGGFYDIEYGLQYGGSGNPSGK
jgi:hypothetical protein